MTKEEKLLFEVLDYVQLSEIPESTETVKDVWIYAIMKVRDHANAENYAIARAIDGKKFSYIKTFGTNGIAEVLSIHPYKFLDMSYAAGIKSEADMRRFVSEVYGVAREEVDKISKEDLLRLFFAYGIKRQLSGDVSPVKLADRREKAARKAEADKTEILKPKRKYNGKLNRKTDAEA